MNTNWRKFAVLFILITVTVSVAFAGCTEENVEPQSNESDGNQTDNMDKDLTKVTVANQWKLTPTAAYWFVAKEKGYFEDVGLDVEVLGIAGSMKNVNALEADRVDFAAPAGDVLVQAKEKGLDAKMLFNYAPAYLSSIASLESKGITEPKDLEGKTVAAVSGSAELQMFEPFCKNAGVNYSKVNIKEVNFGARQQLLLQGKVDAALLLTPYVPQYESKGYDLNRIDYVDYNVSVYSNGIVAKNEYIENNPETTKKFIQACQKAWKYSYENPEEAVDIFLEYKPSYEQENVTVLYDKFKVVTNSFYWTNTPNEHALGWMSEDRWEGTIDFVEKYTNVTVGFEANEMFTNKFLKENITLE